MGAQERLDRLASFLYALSAVAFAGIVLELLAAKHYQEPMQILPFALSGLGLATVLWAWRRPSARAVGALRWSMAPTFVASLLGVWKHLEGNIGFVAEMHPDVRGWALLASALTGRAPLLASGALAAAAAVALAATWAAGWAWRSAAAPRGVLARQRT